MNQHPKRYQISKKGLKKPDYKIKIKINKKPGIRKPNSSNLELSLELRHAERRQLVVNDVVGGSDGARAARATHRRCRRRRARAAVDGKGEAGGAGARPAPFPARQDALPRHVEADRRDRYVELVADRLEGLAAGDALRGPAELLVRAADTTVRAAACRDGRV